MADDDLITMKHTEIAMTGSLEATDDAAKAVQKTPNRVTLNHLESRIVDEEYIHPELFTHLTICCVLLDNGFVLVGKSAPADPANFNEELGRKFAREDAIRQMWPLEGYLLCERLTEAEGER
jgi:Phage protein (N4 Gp49/phage Sf6 gene 66) family